MAVGAGVGDVSAGQYVYVHDHYACGRCRYCLEGDEAACADYEVMGVQRDGGYAELVVAPAGNVFPLPEGLAPQTAAAAGSVYLTAYHMLFARAGLRAGEAVLVTAGGSGSAARRSRCADGRRSRDCNGLDRGEAGATARCRRRAGRRLHRPGWPGEVRALTGGAGVDPAVDHVGGASFAGALSSLANRGRIVLCGASSGTRAELDLVDLFARQVSIIGSSDGSRRELVEAFRLLAEGRVAPPVVSAVLPLERAADAQALLASPAPPRPRSARSRPPRV